MSIVIFEKFLFLQLFNSQFRIKPLHPSPIPQTSFSVCKQCENLTS